MSGSTVNARKKPGCVTCKKRHYKCDLGFPRCGRCQTSKLECLWPREARTDLALRPIASSDQLVVGRASSSASPDRETINRSFAGLGLDGRRILLSQVEDESTVARRPKLALSTQETDVVMYYMSQFHRISFQMYSTHHGPAAMAVSTTLTGQLPTILKGKGAQRMTSWANYFLPNLALSKATDPLSLAISAFTASRLRDFPIAARCYTQALAQLRLILQSKQAGTMDNQAFLRLWATTLLLAEYESNMGNMASQVQHVEAATTLSAIAASRFRVLDTTLAEAAEEVSAIPAQAASEPTPLNEQQLPGYLNQLTQRLHHSATIIESLDSKWPAFETPLLERESLGGLLEQSAICYGHCMPLCERFYTRLSTHPPQSQDEMAAFMQELEPAFHIARSAVQTYKEMLARLPGRDCWHSCAPPGFPFSPVIVFRNPLMAQPMIMPHVFTLFLAPFLTDEEHDAAVRYMTGCWEGFEKDEQLDAMFPDLYVAAFWKAGEERAWFAERVRIERSTDFQHLLAEVYAKIDGFAQGMGRPANKTEILGITFKAYREGQRWGMGMYNQRH